MKFIKPLVFIAWNVIRWKIFVVYRMLHTYSSHSKCCCVDWVCRQLYGDFFIHGVHFIISNETTTTDCDEWRREKNILSFNASMWNGLKVEVCVIFVCSVQFYNQKKNIKKYQNKRYSLCSIKKNWNNSFDIRFIRRIEKKYF